MAEEPRLVTRRHRYKMVDRTIGGLGLPMSHVYPSKMVITKMNTSPLQKCDSNQLWRLIAGWFMLFNLFWTIVIVNHGWRWSQSYCYILLLNAIVGCSPLEWPRNKSWLTMINLCIDNYSQTARKPIVGYSTLFNHCFTIIQASPWFEPFLTIPTIISLQWLTIINHHNQVDPLFTILARLTMINATLLLSTRWRGLPFCSRWVPTREAQLRPEKSCLRCVESGWQASIEDGEGD